MIGVSLRDGERLLREEHVAFQSLTTRVWPAAADARFPGPFAIHAAHMSLTNQRLLFEPPTGMRAPPNQLVGTILAYFTLFLWFSVPTLKQRQQFELADVTRVLDPTAVPTAHRGISPLMFQIGTDGWSFYPIRSAMPLRIAAEVAPQLYADVSSAWRIAKRA
jgi:hypothetical protein